MFLINRKDMDTMKIPKSRVQLHLHLEGSVRLTTIWELSQRKGIKLTPNETFEELRNHYIMKKPESLEVCLNLIAEYYRIIVGDVEAIERIAYELCEDQFLQNVLYFEVRMNPQYSSNTVEENPLARGQVVDVNHPNALTPKQVVETVLKGLKRGEQDFGVHSSLILSCITIFNEWNEDILDLAQEFRDKGVVGIDIAGPESMDPENSHTFNEKTVELFRKAKELNIHRTVHAGEVGPACNVAFAVDKLFAERIGHGYNGVLDDEVYRKCQLANIHFEICPVSSYLAAGVSLSVKHPVVKLAEDLANFSINSDDPTVFGNTLDDDYLFVSKMGLNEFHLVRANINALKSSFLPENRKLELLQYIYKLFGL
ncbi:adenosine deaminase-like [Oppia nitens]|uniref:adenosine deaminase-like n=1 Tax=Oppia nitens TaxID=1686743 RepID=UPI0023DC4003|nr:adenosine deaminase-like [Oppia nitens]